MMYQSSFKIKTKELRKLNKKIKKKTTKLFTLKIKGKYLRPKKMIYQSSFKIIKQQKCLL